MNKNSETEVTTEMDKKSVEEWYEEMNRQFEEDSKTEDYSLSKEWDEDFRSAMFGEPKVCKTRKCRKLAYVAAGIAAAAVVGFGVAQKEVIADNLEKIFNNNSDEVDSELKHFGTKEETSVEENEYDRVIVYKDKSLTEVYDQIRDSVKRPFFQLQDNLGEYEIEDAVYVAEYDMMMMQLVTTEGRVFISQREVLDNTVFSTKIDENSIVVWNTNLKQDIVINKSVQDASYTFSVQKEHVIFTFNGYISEKMCVEMAESLMFK